MLLNVPPNPDGSIPQEMKDLLGEVGEWLSVNGEAIYGTRITSYNVCYTKLLR